MSNPEFHSNSKTFPWSVHWPAPSAYLPGAISHSSGVGFAPNERQRKGNRQSYSMGTLKNRFGTVWYRGTASQSSDPRGSLAEASPNQGHVLTSTHETYRQQRGGIIRSEKCLNSGHFLTYSDQSPKSPCPPKQLSNSPHLGPSFRWIRQPWMAGYYPTTHHLQLQNMAAIKEHLGWHKPQWEMMMWHVKLCHFMENDFLEYKLSYDLFLDCKLLYNWRVKSDLIWSPFG